MEPENNKRSARLHQKRHYKEPCLEGELFEMCIPHSKNDLLVRFDGARICRDWNFCPVNFDDYGTFHYLCFQVAADSPLPTNYCRWN